MNDYANDAQELSEDDRKKGERARQAELIASNPVMQEALARMERDIYEAWQDPRISDEQVVELRRLKHTLTRFIDIFDIYLQDGAASRAFMGVKPVDKSFSQRVKEFFTHGN